MIKPGYRTSEFWFTLVSFIFSGLYLVGILKENEHKEELIQIVSHAVESTILISGQVLILHKYIKGRNEVKTIATRREQPEETIYNDNSRTNTKSSRKKQPASKRTSSKSKKSSIK